GARGFSAEECVSPFGGLFIEAALRRNRGWNRQLIEVKRRKLSGNQVRIILNMAEVVRGRDRELRRIVEPRIEECSLAVHLQSSDEGIPITHCSPGTGPGVEIHSRLAKCGRN